jgi:(5-formylfuran-3-yl)methyl phosphate transaminase
VPCESDGAAVRTCMGIVDEAARLERLGKPVVHLEKGEMDLDTPEVVKEAAIRALRANRTRYSHSSGLPELRQAICDYYDRVYGVAVDPARVIVSSGSSPAMLELFLALLEPGDEVILPNPCYPAYPSFVEAARGRVVWAGTAEHDFAFTADIARPHLSAATKAIFVNSPSNPVGALVEADDLRGLAELGPVVVSDEVYHPLVFERGREHTILEFTENSVVVGSFSKGFAMTGWRVGYLIVPEALVQPLVRMHQYLFVGTNTFVQWAAITALENAETVQRRLREELLERRDTILRLLPEVGFEAPRVPDGGFYVFARQPEGTGTSRRFAADLLEQTYVATTPGPEFGSDGEGYIRFSLSAPSSAIEEAMERIAGFLVRRPAEDPDRVKEAVA